MLKNGFTSLSSCSSPKTLTRFSICFQLASAGGTLSINLIHFENEKSLKTDGNCCDIDGDGKCTCQYYFIICISETGSQNCSIKRIWTNTLAYEEHYVFGDHFYEVPSGEEVQNPIILPVSRWSVSEATYYIVSGPVYTIPFSNENGTKSLRFGLPFTLNVFVTGIK